MPSRDMVGLRRSTITLLGVATGLFVAGLISFARDGTFAFHYASFGGITFLGFLVLVLADFGPSLGGAGPQR